MLISDLAMQDMTERSDAALNRLWRILCRPFRSPSPGVAIVALNTPIVATAALPTQPIEILEKDSPDWRRHPQLRRPDNLLPGEPMSDLKRRARAQELRGVLLARSGRFSEARSAFHSALAADPTTDLASTPGFWDLPRRGMFSAIEAYEDHERYRDAAALEACIRRTFRPRIVSSGTATSTRLRAASGT